MVWSRWLLPALAGVAWCGAVNADPEIWLASTPRCNACDMYRQVAQLRHYADAIHYRHQGDDLTVPIREVGKGDLDESILAQLPESAGPASPYWDIQLTVIVVDGGAVLGAGNIAESADPALMVQPSNVMDPPARPAADDPALQSGHAYRDFFVAHWNLEYFLAVALGDRPPRPASHAVDLASPTPSAVGPATVVLWGSAETPRKNALYLSERIGEIRAGLAALNIAPLRFITLYGSGPDSTANDTSYVAGGQPRFRRVAMPIDMDSSAASLNSVLTGVARTAGNHTLLVQVGHSGPAGSPLWGSLRTFTADDLRAATHAGGGTVVMVSGGCNSGLFAEAVQCGFFAAHPKVLASGCQRSPEAIAGSDDYLRYFFRAATGQAGDGPDEGSLPTLADAHWYAAARLEDHQIAYTTTDALIDDYFAAHAASLPAAMTVARIVAMANLLPPAEARTLRRLTAALDHGAEVGLTDLVTRNHAAEEVLADATELTSAERNAMIHLPYKLMLPMLARRAVYRSLAPADPAFAAAAACETQTVRSFLAGSGG